MKTMMTLKLISMACCIGVEICVDIGAVSKPTLYILTYIDGVADIDVDTDGVFVLGVIVALMLMMMK